MWYLIGVIVLLLILFFVWRFWQIKKLSNVKESERIIHANEHTFRKLINRGVVLVDFWAPWCMPCKMLQPVLNELADNELLNARIIKVNVDAERNLAVHYGIRSIPTLIVFKNGKEMQRIIGVKPKEQIIKILKQYHV